MNWTKRVYGVMVLLLGVVGFITCIAGIVMVCSFYNRLDGVLVTTFERVDSVLVQLEDRVSEATDQVQGLQDSFHKLNDGVQQRVAEARDVPKEEAADLDQIERQIYLQFQQTKTGIEFIQSTVELITQILEMIESTSNFLQEDSRTTEILVASLRSAQDEFQLTSKLVEEVRQELVEVQANRNVDKMGIHVRTITSRIETSLAKLEGYSIEFEEGVSQARADITLLGERVRWKLASVALVAIVIFLWMAVGQLCLAAYGRRILRSISVSN